MAGEGSISMRHNTEANFGKEMQDSQPMIIQVLLYTPAVACHGTDSYIHTGATRSAYTHLAAEPRHCCQVLYPPAGALCHTLTHLTQTPHLLR